MGHFLFHIILSAMKTMMSISLISFMLIILSSCKITEPGTDPPNNIRAYLSAVGEDLTDHALSDIIILADWEKQRQQRYGEFIEMMGLQDMPLTGNRPDLNIRITGTIQEDGYRIEKLYYESLPGLYVPANLYIPDNIQHLGFVRFRAALIDNRKADTEAFGKCPGHFNRADIRSHNLEAVHLTIPEVIIKQVGGIQMIRGNIEKALDLRDMQIHGYHPIRSGGCNQVGQQFGGYGHTRLALAILAGIAVIGYHSRDSLGRCPAAGLDHYQKFHYVFSRRIGRLNNEYIGAPDIFVNFNENLAIGKMLDFPIRQRYANIIGNLLSQRYIGCTR